MKNLSLTDTLAIIEEGSLVLLYLSMPNCSVCHAVQPRIKQMFEDTDLPMLALDAFEVPEVAGTFQVMTAPAILVFYQGKEVHRQARDDRRRGERRYRGRSQWSFEGHSGLYQVQERLV